MYHKWEVGIGRQSESEWPNEQCSGNAFVKKKLQSITSEVYIMFQRL